MKIRVLCLVSLAALSTAAGQEDEGRARVEKMLTVAREGSPAVRGQAAKRLLRDREVALAILLDRTNHPQAFAALGPAVIEVLGEFHDTALRERLWRALADRDFPWRPAAGRALGTTAAANEHERFEPFLRDPIAAVRAAALEGIVACDPEHAAESLRFALLDRNDQVRRTAAERLVRRGERWALRWLVEELKRDDQFFFQLDGRNARFQAQKLLGELKVDLHGYRAASPPGTEDNARALAAIERDLARDLENAPVAFPEHARASGRLGLEPVLGIELRSCREGELFLRFTPDDVLHVGSGRAVAIDLPEGTCARLRERATALLPELGTERIFGEPGCDLEQIYWPHGERILAFRVSKGYEPIDGLRPAPITRLLQTVAEVLPETIDSDDPAHAHLRARLLATLTAIGGPI